MKTRTRYCWGLAAVLALLAVAVSAADSDFQTWQWYTVPFYEAGNFRFQGFFETRWNEDSSHFKLALISPQFDYKILPCTRAGLNYTFIRNDPFDAVYHDQHRLEPQISNSFPLTKDLSLVTRNRLEFRWIDGEEGVDKRIRSRIGAEYKLKDLGPLTGIYANNEIFYDITLGRFNENRAIPIGLEFEINKNVTLDLFNMIQSVEQEKGWRQNIILGTHIRFKF